MFIFLNHSLHFPFKILHFLNYYPTNTPIKSSHLWTSSWFLAFKSSSSCSTPLREAISAFWAAIISFFSAISALAFSIYFKHCFLTICARFSFWSISSLTIFSSCSRNSLISVKKLSCVFSVFRAALPVLNVCIASIWFILIIGSLNIVLKDLGLRWNSRCKESITSTLSYS